MSELHDECPLTLLPVPVPPMLEEALGYGGDARYCGFFWTREGDEASWDDGCQSFVGGDPWSYVAFVRHRSVAPALRGYDLGSSDTQATHWLVLDREARQLYIAEVRVAQQFLCRQWKWEEEPGAQPLVISSEQLLQLVNQAMRSLRERQKTVQAQRCQDLTSWLECL
jgi:hypothetical protein